MAVIRDGITEKVLKFAPPELGLEVASQRKGILTTHRCNRVESVVGRVKRVAVSHILCDGARTASVQFFVEFVPKFPPRREAQARIPAEPRPHHHRRSV